MCSPQSCAQHRLKHASFDDDRQVVRFDREDDADLSKEQEEMLLEELNALLKKEKFNAIILQDYNKGVLTKKIIKQILLITAKLNIPVVVDPKEYNFFEYQQIDLFKPNLKELSDALKIKIDPKNINSLRKAAEELKKKNRFDNLMLTLGPNGIFIYEQNGDSYIVPSRVIKTADVSGAGDTVVSIAALGLAQKLPLMKVAKLANIAAGKVCKKVGVCPITLKDLK
jgi:rfaE bifunctional protein kinase chain/domain